MGICLDFRVMVLLLLCSFFGFLRRSLFIRSSGFLYRQICCFRKHSGCSQARTPSPLQSAWTFCSKAQKYAWWGETNWKNNFCLFRWHKVCSLKHIHWHTSWPVSLLPSRNPFTTSRASRCSALSLRGGRSSFATSVQVFSQHALSKHKKRKHTRTHSWLWWQMSDKKSMEEAMHKAILAVADAAEAARAVAATLR